VAWLSGFLADGRAFWSVGARLSGVPITFRERKGHAEYRSVTYRIRQNALAFAHGAT
jgi:hypothetical protein